MVFTTRSITQTIFEKDRLQKSNGKDALMTKKEKTALLWQIVLAVLIGGSLTICSIASISYGRVEPGYYEELRAIGLEPTSLDGTYFSSGCYAVSPACRIRCFPESSEAPQRDSVISYQPVYMEEDGTITEGGE